VNSDGTYTVALYDEPLDGAFSEFQLAFTSGVKGGNSDQLIFFDSTEPDANPVDGIPDGSTIMALATAFDSDGTVGTVNSSTNGMGVSQGNTIDVNDGVSEKLFLDFGEPVNPALINGKGDSDFIPRLITFATITFNILDNGEFAIVGVYLDGVADPVYFKVAGFGNGASAASDVFLTIDQGTTGDTSIGGDGSIANPYVVDMNGQVGTAYVDGSFATLEFQADVTTDSDYRLLSAQGIDITSGTDVQTSFTAEAIDSDGDTADAVFDVTFDAGNDLVGTAGDDVIVDDGGANTISDGAGNDIIIGGDGADIISLAADGETDVLVFSDISEVGDIVIGFDVSAPTLGDAGGDVIDLADLLATGTFAGTTLGDAEVGGYVELFQSGGNVEVRVDLNGGGDSFTTVVTLNGINVADLTDNVVVD
jgi:Ca2+-binding RTX toxin-like protein